MAYMPMYIPMYYGGGDLIFSSSIAELITIIGILMVMIGIVVGCFWILIDSLFDSGDTLMRPTILLLFGGCMVTVTGVVFEIIMELIS